MRTIRVIRQRSTTLNRLAEEGKIAIVGGLYDVSTGEVNFFQTQDSGFQKNLLPMLT